MYFACTACSLINFVINSYQVQGKVIVLSGKICGLYLYLSTTTNFYLYNQILGIVEDTTLMALESSIMVGRGVTYIGCLLLTFEVWMWFADIGS